MQAVIAERLGRNVSSVPVRVVDSTARAVSGVTAKAQFRKMVASEGRTDADGRVDLILNEVGAYALSATQSSRAAAHATLESPGAAGALVEVAVGEHSEAVFDVVDVTSGRKRGPVKVMLCGLDGTPTHP